MSSPPKDELQTAIRDFQVLARALWLRQAHVAAGLSWEQFLLTLGVMSPATIRPPAVAQQGAPVPELPGFDAPG